MARDDDFLSRWSRRKSEAKRPGKAGAEDEDGRAGRHAAHAPVPQAAPESPAPGKPELPPVESLTAESDFSPFMAPEVDGDTRARALKALFADPHFNTMDMLDVYVDDYSKPDPIPESWLARLEQASRLGDRAGRDREEAERGAGSADRGTVEEDAEAAAREELPADPTPSSCSRDPGNGEPPAGEKTPDPEGHSSGGSR